MINEAPLTKDQRTTTRRLAALLRVADGIDSEHRRRVSDIVATRMGDVVVLDLIVRDGPTRDDAQLTRKADLFRADLMLLGIRFSGKLNVELRQMFGPFGDSACRIADAADAERLLRHARPLCHQLHL